MEKENSAHKHQKDNSKNNFFPEYISVTLINNFYF